MHQCVDMMLIYLQALLCPCVESGWLEYIIMYKTAQTGTLWSGQHALLGAYEALLLCRCLWGTNVTWMKAKGRCHTRKVRLWQTNLASNSLRPALRTISRLMR